MIIFRLYKIQAFIQPPHLETLFNMSSPDLKVRFHYDQKNITIWFKDQRHAEAYRFLTGLNLSSDHHIITLPVLPKLNYIRNTINDLIFGFASNEAAAEWTKRWPLVSGCGNEATIAGTWPKGTLDKELSALIELTRQGERERIYAGVRPVPVMRAEPPRVGGRARGGMVAFNSLRNP